MKKLVRSIAVGATVAVVAGGAGVLGNTLAHASTTPSGISVTGVTETTISVDIPNTEQVQVYAQGSLHQVYRATLGGGAHTVAGLTPGTGYDVRAAGNTGWTAAIPLSTVAAPGAAGTNGIPGKNGSDGKDGAPGATGPAGPKGDPGVALVGQPTTLAPTTVQTGGTFSTRATSLGKITVPNGTYEILFTAKVANVAGQAAQVYPVVTIYDGAPKTDFSNDVFNLGAGALPAIASIDQYIEGSQVVAVKSGEIDIEGFGYDSDRGQGSYTFEGGTVTVESVNG